MQNIAHRLKSLRELNEYTQKEIAEILGTTQQTYCNYEIGKYEIPVHHILKLCELYRVTSDYLLGLSTHKTAQPNLNMLFYKNVSYGEYFEMLSSLSNENKKSSIDYIQFLISRQTKK